MVKTISFFFYEEVWLLFIVYKRFFVYGLVQDQSKKIFLINVFKNNSLKKITLELEKAVYKESFIHIHIRN